MEGDRVAVGVAGRAAAAAAAATAATAAGVVSRTSFLLLTDLELDVEAGPAARSRFKSAAEVVDVFLLDERG
jgi:hypothetical protein